MSQCPSCNQHTGPYEACPYCGARLAGRTPIRIVKIAAILLATVGLAALWLAATHAQVPLIEIGQAGATMNMAYVRVQGRCSREPSYDPEGEYLSFWLEDESGEIMISSYRAETQQIIAQDRVPALGDTVEVAGTLRVREDFYALTLNVPEQLTITRADPVTRDIGSLASGDQYLRVRVRGEVRSVYEPYDGLTLVTMRDETGEVPLAVNEDAIALSAARPEESPEWPVATGQWIEVVATVSLYGDTPQLVPAALGDITVLDNVPRTAAEKTIGEVTAADLGQSVTVQGHVAKIDVFGSGVKLTLDDGSGTVVVLLWQDVYDALPDPAALDAGAEVRVQGAVNEYEGELEIIPELAADVQVLAAAPPPAEMTIAALTGEHVGEVVMLRGTLGEPDPFSAGVKFSLDDGSGTIVLLLWQDVYDAFGDADQLVAGAQVEVTGQIEEYQGELEIIPRVDGIRIIEGTSRIKGSDFRAAAGKKGTP